LKKLSVLVVAPIAVASAFAFGITAHASTTYTVPQNFGTFNTSQTATLSVSPTSAVTAGDLLVADIATKNVTGQSQQCYVPAKSVADGTSDVWIEASDAQLTGGQVDSSVWYTSPTAGLTTSSSITVTVGSDGVSGCSSYTTAAIAMTVIDVTPSGPGVFSTTSNPAIGTGTAVTANSLHNAPQNEFAYVGIGFSKSETVSAQKINGSTPPFAPTQISTVPSQNVGEQAAWDLSTNTIAYTSTLSTSTNWGSHALLFAFTPLKPDIAGFLDRGTVPSQPVAGSNFDWPLTSGWTGNPIAGIVVNETWADLQPNGANTTIIASANGNGTNNLDTALSDVTTWNTAHPTIPVHIKLRVWAGEDAPLWAKQISPGPIEGTANGSNTCSATNFSCIGPFWSSTYEADYANLQSQLATLYDSNPLIENVVDSACMTQNAEPMLQDDYNSGSGKTNLLAATYTDVKGYNCNVTSITNMEVWKQTHVSLSFNPYSMLTLPGSGNESGLPVNCSSPSPCEALTEYVMDTFASDLQGQAAVENNSIRYPTLGGSYPAMYAHILTEQTTYAVKGLTVDYQTATLSTLEGSTMCNGVSTPCEGLSEAINWSCSGTDMYQTSASGQTASSVELPFGYTSAIYSPYDDFTTPGSYAAYVTCVDKDPHG
jgi:hypothetical protein